MIVAVWLAAAASLAWAAPSFAQTDPKADTKADTKTDAKAAKPQRVMSLYLCADQLLLALLPRERIASISYLATDATISYYHKAARGLPVNYGLAEQAIAARADLILTGPFAHRSQIELLRRLGLNVRSVGYPNSFAAVRQELRDIAALIGTEAAAEKLIADMDARLARVAPAPARRPLGAIFLGGSATIGKGEFVGEVMARAGFDNLAEKIGIVGVAPLDMEILLAHEPDLLIVGSSWDGRASIASSRLSHPALRDAFAGKHLGQMPEHLWTCAGHWSVEAVELLVAQRPEARFDRGRWLR